jgi:HSP20 family protein
MAITDLIPWKREKIAVRHEERDPVHAFQRDVNRLFDEFFGGFDLAPFGEQWEAYSPRVDVVESEKEVKVTAELPGMVAQDVDLQLSHGVLTISGEKKREKEERGKNYTHVERSYGAFRRSVPLPGEVDSDKVEATFKRGVLTVTLPKTTPARARIKVAVKRG